MKAAVEAEGGPFPLFGGETLLLPMRDLEALFAWGFEKYGGSSVQTNGSTLRDGHIDLFKRYNVHVGLSMDGPGELNSPRQARSGSKASTNRATARSEAALVDLLAAGVTPGLIVTLHRENASAEALPVMAEWFQYLDGLGLRSVVLHVLENESADLRRRLGLTTGENIAAMNFFRALQPRMKRLRFTLFDELRGLLLGADEQASCVWNGCDPLTTRAVRGVEGLGKRTNCGRVNKEGIDFVKSDDAGYERYIMLYHTDQAQGGCSGCRFFLMCKGYCPGTALEGDWRNRTEYCGLWFGLFEQLEGELLADGLQPLSQRADRADLESRLLNEWMSGRNPRLADLI